MFAGGVVSLAIVLPRKDLKIEDASRVKMDATWMDQSRLRMSWQIFGSRIKIDVRVPTAEVIGIARGERSPGPRAGWGADDVFRGTTSTSMVNIKKSDLPLLLTSPSGIQDGG